jgi:hypothetical protein
MNFRLINSKYIATVAFTGKRKDIFLSDHGSLKENKK